VRLQRISEALGAIEKALTLAPGNPNYISERGVIYLHMKKYPLALMDFDEALRLDPYNAYRYASRAFMKEAAGDLDGALKDYEKAMELDPEDAVVMNNLGLLLEKMGRAEPAKKLFEKADELSKAMPLPSIQPESSEKKTEETEPEEKTESLWSMSLKIIKTGNLRREFWRWLLRKPNKE